MIKNLYNFIRYLIKKHKIKSENIKLIFELLEDIFNYNLQFINENIEQIMFNDIKNDMLLESYDYLYIKYIESSLFKEISNLNQDNFINIMELSINISISIIYKFIIPKREYKKSLIRKINNISINLSNQHQNIKNTIKFLKSIKQPEQRSDEWYIFRNSTLTASNIWKVFGSEYNQTQLILEKCQPIDINKYKVTNFNSPLHWGQKYEPVSTMYYEFINNTKVDEFGCIPHSSYPFIAASPDGIICDETSELFGRMLEIKNVVSREITGIPKMEYWIQMQIQMEVCNLNECDFLETKFLEYTDYEEFINDNNVKYKGIMLLYLNKNNDPLYEYAPFNIIDICSSEYLEWYNKINKNAIEKEYIFEKNIYWKLDKISCILILRNKLWFSSVLSNINSFWENLLYERETEKYKERIKKKQKLEIEDSKSKSDFPNSGCLIDLNDNQKVNTIDNSTNNYTDNFIINVIT